MQEVDIARIKKKSLAGVVAMTTRTFFLQIVAFVATFLLTIFLSPSIFGVFYVVSAFISFLGYFSDIGLAAALIQKKEELSREDLVTTFTIQQALVSLLVVISFIFSAPIASFYRLDSAGMWLFRALIFSFFLSSLKTIPSILLERGLEFQRLVIPTILETLAFYVVAVLLAWQGYGVESFTWAVLARGVVGVIVIYFISPWKVGVGYAAGSARKLLRFGIPFQLNSFLGLLKDDLMTVFLGKVLPFAQLGYIGWAKKWAEVPLRLFMDAVIRVTFPAFARLQHDTKLVGAALEKTLFGLALVIFPVAAGLVFFIEPLVSFVPRYGKWEPALVSFYLFSLASVVAGLSTPLTNALNAVGKIKITLGLMAFWTASTWILTMWLINIFGYNGFAVALSFVSISIILVIYLVQRVAPFRFWRSVTGPLVASVAQCTWYALLRGHAPFDALKILGVAIGGVILYGGIVFALEKERILSIFPRRS